ncbi:MAG: XTP/dITP diphosphatase [Pyrinomonadaceae bacterium]
MELLIATKNAGKIKELTRLLADSPIVLRSLNDFPNVSEPEETGLTFQENAALKAKSYALQTGLRSLADDSGLEVEVLNGAPGIFSARYAGENAGDAEKIQKLLSEIAEKKSENRAARFVCSMVISDPHGRTEFFAEGVCDGKIALQPHGRNGFGYDPVFIPEGFSETFGELSEAVKRKISHRGRAAGKIIEYLRAFIAS